MRGRDEPLYVALTVDVDADANRPCHGRPEAVSPGGEARFEACAQGLEAAADLTAELGWPCTLFWTGRALLALHREAGGVVKRLADRRDVEHACHGFAHEDFTGRDTGRPLSAEETLRTVRAATGVVARITGRTPAGFRAPYCRMGAHLPDALRALGYLYDASLTRTSCDEWDLKSYPLPPQCGGNPLLELALCRGRDASGGVITGYLWQLLEGRREPRDYVDFVASLACRFPGGLFQIALHPWHLLIDKDGRPLPTRSGRDAASDLRAVLQGVASLAVVRLTTGAEYLRLQKEHT
ncbi:MAG: polysaccharide deacetylase family protein [Candidatus Brocadiia bacterium]|jgi:hypothetical protein|nr:polysaccharide deacetylase family protein [Candidatus Brocadiia bacterium]